MANRIPLDPKLPKLFDQTPNEQRSKAQLDAWWDHPFGVTMADGRIEVRCLNGGAWDRSTHLGVADDYDAACVLAEAKQAAWLRFRERPVGSPQDGKFLLLKMPQRPDEDMVTVGTFDTAEAANEFLRENYPETPR
ncbi:DNA-binding protein [Escherichia coli]|nr:DNA-binding protein [Escherichia coli]